MSSSNCSLCGARDQVSNLGLCARCHERLAIPAHTEPLRPYGPCARCSGTEFVRSLAVREWAARERLMPPASRRVEPYLTPLALSYRPMVQTSMWSGKRLPTAYIPIGLVEAYVCRACGLTEFYTHRPRDIPIGPEYGTELFVLGSEGPFR
jgi:hypothetical protein